MPGEAPAAGGTELAQLEQALEVDPSSTKFAALGEAYLAAQRFEDALRVCHQGLHHHPDHIRGHWVMARALVATDQLPAACGALRELLALDERRAEAYELLAELLLARGEAREAQQVLVDAEAAGLTGAQLEALRSQADELAGPPLLEPDSGGESGEDDALPLIEPRAQTGSAKTLLGWEPDDPRAAMLAGQAPPSPGATLNGPGPAPPAPPAAPRSPAGPRVAVPIEPVDRPSDAGQPPWAAGPPTANAPPPPAEPPQPSGADVQVGTETETVAPLSMSIGDPLVDGNPSASLAVPYGVGRRIARTLLLAAVLAAMAGLGWGVWYYFRQQETARAALERAEPAAISADPKRMKSALRRLGEARLVYGKLERKLAAQRELLSALRRLVHAAAKRPAAASEKSQDDTNDALAAQQLARAVEAIEARSTEKRVSTLLERSARLGTLPAMVAALEGWSRWLAGDPAAASSATTKALAADDDHGIGLLLAGHLARERGALDEATRSYGALAKRSTGHELAALGRAAALVADPLRALDARASKALQPKAHSRLGVVWRRLLRSAADLRDPRLGRTELRLAARAIRGALAALPRRRELLVSGARALSAACAFSAAEAAIDPLPDKDPIARLLRAELAVARGRDTEALRLLPTGKAASRWQRRLRSWVLVRSGRADRLRRLWRGDDSPEARWQRRLGSKRPLDAKRLASGAGDDPLLRLELLHVLVDRGMVDEAKELVAELGKLRLPPATTIALAQASARITRRGGDLKRASEQLTKARERGCSSSWRGALLHAQLQLESGELEKGREALERALKAGARHWRARLTLARADLAAHQLEKAEADLNDAKREGAPRQELGLIRALLLVEQGKLKRALRTLRAAGSSPAVRQALAGVQLEAGQLDDAESTVKALLEQQDSDPTLHLLLAEVYLRKGDSAAAAQLAKALAAASELPQAEKAEIGAAVQLGRARLRLGKRPSRRSRRKALPLLRAAVKANDRSAPGHRLLGETLLELGHRKAARAELERAAELAPRHAETFFLLAKASSKDRAAARKAYERFLELRPRGRRAKKARRALRRLR